MINLENLTDVELLQLQNDLYYVNLWKADENDPDYALLLEILIERNRLLIGMRLDCNGGWNAPFML